MAPLVPFAIAAASTAAVVGTGYSIYAGQKAAKQQQKAFQAQVQQGKLQEARQRRDSIRASRLAYAQAQSGAEAQGVATSSSAQGGQSSIVSQLQDNLSFLDQYGALTDIAQSALGKAQKWESSGNLGAGVAKLGFEYLSNAPTINSTVQKVFNKHG